MQYRISLVIYYHVSNKRNVNTVNII